MSKIDLTGLPVVRIGPGKNNASGFHLMLGPEDTELLKRLSVKMRDSKASILRRGLGALETFSDLKSGEYLITMQNTETEEVSKFVLTL